MLNCDYCQGDRDGFVTKLPQTKGNGSAYVFIGNFTAKIEVRLPFGKVNQYQIKYCPMCGRRIDKRMN